MGSAIDPSHVVVASLEAERSLLRLHMSVYDHAKERADPSGTFMQGLMHEA